MSEAIFHAVRDIVGETLGLGARTQTLTPATQLFGSMPELDSLAVVDLAMAIESHFGITIDDDDFGGELFETIGSLANYVASRSSFNATPPLAAE